MIPVLVGEKLFDFYANKTGLLYIIFEFLQLASDIPKCVENNSESYFDEKHLNQDEPNQVKEESRGVAIRFERERERDEKEKEKKINKIEKK